MLLVCAAYRQTASDGEDVRASRLPHDSHPELVTMMNERDRFWILQGGRDWDYELLVYDDHRVVVPRNGRYALLQAAHAASHQGLGRMRDLLEKSFYWPRMTLDAQRYAQVCLAARRKGIAPPLAHCQLNQERSRRVRMVTGNSGERTCKRTIGQTPPTRTDVAQGDRK